MKVDDIMTPVASEDIVSVNEDDKVIDALKKFQKSQKNRLIVQQGNTPEKILTIADIVGVKPNMKIKIIAPKLAPVNKVLTGDDIQKVISAQASQPITIVFNTSQKPVGIITPSDVLRYVKKFRTS